MGREGGIARFLAKMACVLAAGIGDLCGGLFGVLVLGGIVYLTVPIIG
jgi:hypothetical protein